MARHPIFLLGAAASLGAACTQPFAIESRLIVLCAIAAFVAWVGYTRAELGRLRAAIAGALVAGALSGVLHAAPATLPAVSHTTRIACTVLGDEAQDLDAVSYTCISDAGVRFAVTSSGAAPAIASRVLLRGRIEAFDPPRNPGEPDRAAIERERNIFARISNARILAHLPPAQPAVPIAVARVHAWALAQLRAHLQEPYATILAGELWGDRAGLPPELRSEFQETGTVHILVTAGLHLGVVAALLLGLLRALTVPRISASALAAAAIWAYALFSGLHLPAIRAASMLMFALAAFACGRAVRSWNVFGAALLVIALFDPAATGSASFALSFSCVGAILLCADLIDEQLEKVAALPERFREVLAVTCATQLGTWPLTASTFLLFAPYAGLANLAVVPCVGTTMILGAAQLALAAWPNGAQTIADLNAWLLAWIVAAVHTISTLPYATIASMPPPGWTIALYDCLLGAAVFAWRSGARTTAIAFIFIGSALLAYPPREVDHRLRITVLDVGQADAIVIRTPARHTFLVDAGGRLERGRGAQSLAERVGELVVVPYLRREGIRTIDALIISHPHGDHVGGAPVVLRNLTVKHFADSGQRYGGYAYNHALQIARSDRVPLIYPRAGTTWRTGDGVTLTFIGPALPFITGSRNDINNNSLAFILQYGRFRMLFEGDAGAEAERRFLAESVDLHADVLVCTF